MKTLIAAVFALSTVGAIAQNKPMTTTMKVDPSTSKVEWVGKKVAGEHMGTVSVKNGEVSFTGDELTGGTVVMDMNSITVTDLKEKEWNDKLVGHLKAPDFFDTQKYPEATLKIKNSKKSKEGLDVTGDLTIRGITQPVSFKATNVKKTADAFTADAKILIDRTKYGVVYNAGKGDKDLIKSLGDKMIYDEFTLNAKLSAKK